MANVVHDSPQDNGGKGLAFWMIFVSLCLSLFLSALELTAVSTALPVIVRELQGAEFAWVGTAYSLASTAFIPLSGGIAEIFGRRISILGALSFFALGSVLCGTAKTMQWLIAARAIQGLGGGAILSLSSIIVSDLVSLRERGAYNGIIGMTWAIAVAIGPIVGGALASHNQWRWLFYLNLPLCALSITAVLLFLNLPTPPGALREKLARMDWLGNILVVASTTGVVLGLTWGGTTYSWSSAAVLVPLITGAIGFVVFFLYEFYLAENPLIPFLIMSNRTSLSGYIQNFLNPVVVLTIAYYIPVYYQACKDASPVHSGVLFMGLTLILGPVGVVAGVSVRVLQKYRPQLWIGWVLFIAGMAGLTTLTADSSTAKAVGLPVLVGAGCGVIYTVAYFPVLAPLPVSLNAPALAFFSFCRSFAAVWGITIGSAVLQNELPKHLPAEILAQLPSGRVDFLYTLVPIIRDLPEPLKHQTRIAFADAVAVIWKVAAALLGVAFISSFFMRALPLQDVVDDKWAMDPTVMGDKSAELSTDTSEA